MNATFDFPALDASLRRTNAKTGQFGLVHPGPTERERKRSRNSVEDYNSFINTEPTDEEIRCIINAKCCSRNCLRDNISGQCSDLRKSFAFVRKIVKFKNNFVNDP